MEMHSSWERLKNQMEKMKERLLASRHIEEKVPQALSRYKQFYMSLTYAQNIMAMDDKL